MGYQEETTRLFKGKGFRVNAFPDEAAKGEARSRFNERVSQLQPEWTLVTRNENNALMIDAAKNIKTICLAWGLLDGGPRLVETTVDDNYIKHVRIKMNPCGVPGVRNAADAILDSSNRGSVQINVKFVAGFLSLKVKNDLIYDVVSEKKIPINIENLERIVAKAQRELILIRSFFGDKIDQDETAGLHMML
jgi:hypothetical protein